MHRMQSRGGSFHHQLINECVHLFTKKKLIHRCFTISSFRQNLFGIEELKSPVDFQKLSKQAILQCDAIKKELDAISNSVCSVVDVAELCRNVHPEKAYRDSANQSYSVMSEYIQRLNTDVEIYHCLRQVTDQPEIMSSFTEEQQRMAIKLQAEFERDGIHLSLEKRHQVVQLRNEVTRLETLFQHILSNAQEMIEIPLHVAQILPPHILTSCEILHWKKQVRVPTDKHIMDAVLKWVGDASIRQAMYRAGNTCAKANLEVLDALIQRRHELAQLLGFQSYSHFVTSDTMAEDPLEIQEFLEDLSFKIRAKAKQELEMMQKSVGKKDTSQVNSWDLPYYMGMLKAKEYNLDARVIASYFPLHHCIEGLGILCSFLFGMKLVKVPMEKGESWDKSVEKLALLHETDGTIGYIYLDLFPRKQKFTHAAHFTIRCGYSDCQVPVVALVCNFATPTRNQPSLLTHSDLETLFHEFGHALHSLLSRTEFQHFSGTRVQLDFVETPSHLFEYFAWDYRFLSLFAKHYQTNEPIPEEMMKQLKKSKHMFAAMDVQSQLLYSLLDQSLFGVKPKDSCAFPSSTEIIQQLQEKHTNIRYAKGTYWHTRFGHLIGYGGGYYSYLYAKVFAAHLWSKLFALDCLNRESGELLRQKLLCYGGAKDPRVMLESLLEEKPSITSYLEEIGVVDPSNKTT